MWLLSKNAGFCCLFGAQVSAAYALTEGDASGPAQTLLAADTESDSDPDEPGDADTDVEIDPDGVDFGQYITKSEAQWRKNKNDSWHS